MSNTVCHAGGPNRAGDGHTAAAAAGLGPGAIAGIAIGVVALVAVVVLGVRYGKMVPSPTRRRAGDSDEVELRLVHTTDDDGLNIDVLEQPYQGRAHAASTTPSHVSCDSIYESDISL
jgi:hypothetical protein